VTPEPPLQVAQQGDFALRARRVAPVPAFGGNRVVPCAVPEQQGLAQAGPQRDHGDVAPALGSLSRVQDREVIRCEEKHAKGRRFDVVEKPRAARAGPVCQRVLFDAPREIGQPGRVPDDGPSNP
jgi:hypothetical protein